MFKKIAEERSRIIAENRALYKKADAEVRTLDATELETIKAGSKRVGEITNTMQAYRDQVAQEARESEEREEREEIRVRAERDAERQEVRGAFQPIGQEGESDSGESPETPGVAQAVHERLRAYSGDRYLANFRRAIRHGRPPEALLEHNFQNLNTESDQGGNFLMPPPAMISEFLREARNDVYLRQYARMFPQVGRRGLSVPYQTRKLNSPERVSPLGKGTKGSIEGDRRNLIPTQMKLTVRLEMGMMGESSISEDELLREQINDEFEDEGNRQYFVGSGKGDEGLGLFTASDDGIGVSRDFDKFQFANALTFKGLRHVKNRLPEKWRRKGAWFMHTDRLEDIENIQDNNGKFVYQESVREDQADRLFGRDLRVEDHCPNSTGPGAYAVLFGYFKYFWIVEGFGGIPQIQFLSEVFHESNEYGYVARFWNDHAPVMPTAFARGKFGQQNAP